MPLQMPFVKIKDSPFHRVIQDSMKSPITMANHAAICASLKTLNDKAFPHLQRSGTFRALSLPKNYLEEIKEIKEILKAGLEKLNTFGNYYLVLGREYHQLFDKYHRLGLDVTGGVKIGALLVLGIAVFGGLYFSGKFIYVEWLSAPRSVADYQRLLEKLLAKKDLYGALDVLLLMLEKDFIPSKSMFESVLRSILADQRVQIASKVASKVLRMIDELEVSIDSDLLCDVFVALLLKGKAHTALKRMENLGKLNLGRIIERLIVAEKKPTTLTCQRLVAFLFSKKEVGLANRLLDNGLGSGWMVPPIEGSEES